jgi:aminotransferase
MIDYESCIPSRIQEIKPSGIRKFFDLVSGRPDVISLTVGEPDFVTPWHIRMAGIESLEKGKTYYTANAGLLELREAISAYTKEQIGVHYDPKTEILVTVGGSEAIDLALRTLISHGDEVLFAEPCFVCYKPCTLLAGGTPVVIPLKESDEFRLRANDVRAHLTDKTRVLILSFPNNPTGAIMEREDLEEIARIAVEHDLMVISDEIYADLTYKGEHVSIASFPGMKERYIRTYGNAYELPSPRARELKKIFRGICEESGMMSEPDDCFRYMNELPERYTQMSMFDMER